MASVRRAYGKNEAHALRCTPCLAVQEYPPHHCMVAGTIRVWHGLFRVRSGCRIPHKCRSAFPSFASAHQHASILQSKLQTSRWTSVGRNNTHIDAGTATFGTMDVLGNVAHKVRVPQHSAKGCGIEFSGVLTRQAMSGQHVGIVEVPQSRYSVFRIRT